MHNRDKPATRKMLSLVRDELRSEIRSTNLKLGSKIDLVQSEMTSFKTDMKSQVSRMELLLEEQKCVCLKDFWTQPTLE